MKIPRGSVGLSSISPVYLWSTISCSSPLVMAGGFGLNRNLTYLNITLKFSIKFSDFVKGIVLVNRILIGL